MGFFAKLFVCRLPSAWLLLVFAVLISVVGCFYYLRIVKTTVQTSACGRDDA